jgi:hypothetical protein
LDCIFRVSITFSTRNENGGKREPGFNVALFRFLALLYECVYLLHGSIRIQLSCDASRYALSREPVQISRQLCLLEESVPGRFGP